MIGLRQRGVTAAVVGISAALVAALPAAASTKGDVTHYDLEGRANHPYSIMNAHGNVWFTETKGNAIGTLSPSGVLSRFKLPTPHSEPRGIAVSGADGSIWFTEQRTNRIGVMDPLGNLLAEYSIPTPGAKPWDIISASDAPEMWFTEPGADQIGRITSDGQITEYPMEPGSRPTGIGAGLDSTAWFTEPGANAIGRIDTLANDPIDTLTLFDVPTDGARPWDINLNGDLNMWFTEIKGNLGRITQEGTITEFRIPGNSALGTVTSGNGGRLWFTQPVLNRVGSMALNGQVGTFFNTRSAPIGISAGSDSGIYFCESGGNSIGRVEGGFGQGA